MHQTYGSHQNKVGQMSHLGGGGQNLEFVTPKKGVLHYYHKDSGRVDTGMVTGTGVFI